MWSMFLTSSVFTPRRSRNPGKSLLGMNVTGVPGWYLFSRSFNTQCNASDPKPCLFSSSTNSGSGEITSNGWTNRKKNRIRLIPDAYVPDFLAGFIPSICKYFVYVCARYYPSPVVHRYVVRMRGFHYLKMVAHASRFGNQSKTKIGIFIEHIFGLLKSLDSIHCLNAS